MSLRSGSRLGAYEILAPLGAGGMGEVYRARDLRLGREIALKVLPAEMSADPNRLARFEREARTVAGLNHPNIVMLHSVEDDGHVRFLTMELVEGSSLDQSVTPEGLPVPRVIELGIALADALAAAHEKGVVHRDLKPANVMLTRDGRVKVLDFGLAKLAAPDSEASLSQVATMATPVSGAGMIAGTVPYMAPEQVRGEAVDARTDLFALGIVLYELASGARPFAGDTQADVSSAIIRDAPKPLASSRPDLPQDLDRIVSRCLEKNPRERIQSALDVGNELRRLRRQLERGPLGPAAAPEQASIAVMPFVNMSADPDNEFFSDGISEEIISALAQIPDLHVTARTSSFAFKGKNLDLRQVGEKLNVQTVLEGSVRRVGKRIRITAQLIKVADGYQLWSERYDREMEDVFEIQDEIARTIADRLKVTLQGDGGAPLVKAATDNVEAYELYLRGRHYWNQRLPSTLPVAIRCFEKTIELDPDYALAYAGLADCYGILRVYGWVPAEDSRPQAHAAASRAMTLAPELWETNFSQGFYTFYFERDWREAESGFRRAVDINPRSSLAQLYYGQFLAVDRRVDEAVERFTRAQELDPLSPFIHGLATVGYYMVGRFEEADRAGARALELQPDYLLGLWLRGVTASALGRHAAAIEMLERAVALSRAPIFVGVLGSALARAGRRDDAIRLLVELEDRASRGEYVPAFASLAIHTGLGDVPAMRRTLAKVLDEVTPPLSVRCTSFPALEEYRADPEIDRLILELHGAGPRGRTDNVEKT